MSAPIFNFPPDAFPGMPPSADLSGTVDPQPGASTVTTSLSMDATSTTLDVISTTEATVMTTTTTTTLSTPPSSQPMMNMPSLTFPGMPAMPSNAMPTASSPGAMPNMLVLAANNPNPQLPYVESDFLYIKSWMLVHKLSEDSWVYAYILWAFIGFFFLVASLLHQFGMRKGWLGAHYSKRFLKKQTFRKPGELAQAKKMGKKHKQPWSLPSYAQMLTLALLVLLSILLSLVGPDYLRPTGPKPARYYQLRRRAHATLIPEGIMPADYAIDKAWWTFGGRTGLIAFALFPLIVLLGLKYPPFAVFASRWTTEYYFDKLVRLHRWGGRLIYGLTCAHVLGYAVQASIDIRNPATLSAAVDRRTVWHFVVLHLPFRYAIAAFVFFSLLMASSLPWVRTNHYEVFYIMHLICVPGTLIFSALHHQPLAWWCWVALILWLMERAARAARWVVINTSIGVDLPRFKRIKDDTWGRLDNNRWESTNFITKGEGKVLESPKEMSEDNKRMSLIEDKVLHHMHPRSSSGSSAHILPRADPQFDATEKPPPGYAHALLMPGRTVKLRVLTRGPFTWAPGQHVLVCIPSINAWQSHPFTVASICDSEAGGDQEIVLLIRAKAGFTKALWDAVAGQIVARSLHDNSDVPLGLQPPRRGAFLPAYIDGPFGSSVRTKWGQHSTAIIFAGGSGVSFAVAMMEYLCMCLAGRDGRSLGGRPGGRGDAKFKVERVRFVWMVREFAHLSWCASTIRRCIEMVPAPFLEVSLYVSNFQSKPGSRSSIPPLTPTSAIPSMEKSTEALLSPSIARMPRRAVESSVDNDGMESDTSTADLSYRHRSTSFVTGPAGLGHEEHVLDLTNFDGDNDALIPGEASLSQRLRQEGKVRRARTRRLNLEKRRSTGPRRDRMEEGGTTMTIQPPTDSEPEDGEPTLAQPRSAARMGSGGHFGSPHSSMDTSITPRTSHTRPASVASVASFDDTASVRGIRFEIEEKEAEDLAVISEMAVGGKPKFEKIVAEEVEISNGSIAVGCCGPVALNAVIRNVVAAQINPERVKKGDMRGMLSLVSEDFEY